jgi:hypothetical protein
MSERELEPRPPVIAEINYANGYQALVDGMRAHAVTRKIAITSPHIAAMASLPDYYIAKLLSVHPIRRIGMISLGPLLGVLGIKLLMVEDPEAVARYSGKLANRNESCVHNGAAIEFRFSRRHMQKIGKNGAKSRWAKARMLAETASIIAPLGAAARHTALSPQRRSQIARKAALARWAKVAAAQIATAKEAAKEAKEAAKAKAKAKAEAA